MRSSTIAELPEKGSLGVLLLPFGVFSGLANQRDWIDVDTYFNPLGVFDEVHVVAMGDDYDYEETSFGRLQVHPIRSITRNGRLTRLNDAWTLVRGFFRMLSISRAHDRVMIAQVDATPLKFGVPAVVAAKITGRPSLITLCSDYTAVEEITYAAWLKWLSRRLWPFLFRNATRVRSKGAHISSFAIDYCGPEKVRVIPNKEDLDKFRVKPRREEVRTAVRSLGLDPERLEAGVVFLTAARLLPIKNLERALRAFARTLERAPDAVLVIAGDGPERSTLEALVRTLDIDRRVSFVGWQSHGVLAALYHAADVFLLPSLFEGNPRVILEAQMSGLPVVASNHGAIAELVTDERDGLLFDPRDEDDIAAALLRLATDRGLRTRLGSWYPGKFRKYGIGAVSRQEADLYRDAILAHEESRGQDRARSYGWVPFRYSSTLR